MARGAIVYVGKKSREVDLLMARLEKEKYSTVYTSSQGSFMKLFREYSPVAVLVSGDAKPSLVQTVIHTLMGSRSLRHVPVISLGNDSVSPLIEKLTGVGDSLLLHELPVVSVVKRIVLAIQLTQLRKTLFGR